MAESQSSASAWLQLVRLPNLFTAVADVAMGFFFVRQGWWGEGEGPLVLSLAAASVCFYAAGVVLNDVYDLDIDRRERPERPLPSGRISPHTARSLGWALMIAALGLTVIATFLGGSWATALVGLLLGTLVWAYDARLKRTPLGPVGMGGCRLLNVLLGMSVAVSTWQADNLLVAAGIGTYVAGVTWFARREAEESNRLALGGGMAVMAAGIALLALLPLWSDRLEPLLVQESSRWYMLMGILGGLIGWRCMWALADPTPRHVQLAVRQCILSLIMLNAAVTFAAAGQLPAMAVLILLPPTVLLSQWIRAT